jgi:hypothetical protein
MLEKLALLKIALCSAPASTIDSSAWLEAAKPVDLASGASSLVSVFEIEMENS